MMAHGRQHKFYALSPPLVAHELLGTTIVLLFCHVPFKYFVCKIHTYVCVSSLAVSI